MKRSDWQGENDGLQRLPLACKAADPLVRPEKSVEASWPPLTPEHGFPSLHHWPEPRALPLGPLPAMAGAPWSCALPLSFQSVQKNSGPHGGTAELEQPDDFLRWHDPHQVKGSKQQLPLSRGRLPCFSLYYGIKRKKCQEEGCKTDKRGVS